MPEFKTSYSSELIEKEEIGTFKNGVRKLYFDLKYTPMIQSSIKVYLDNNGLAEWQIKKAPGGRILSEGFRLHDPLEHMEYDCLKGHIDLEFDKPITGTIFVTYEFDVQEDEKPPQDG